MFDVPAKAPTLSSPRPAAKTPAAKRRKTLPTRDATRALAEARRFVGPVQMRVREGTSSTLGVVLPEPQPLHARRALGVLAPAASKASGETLRPPAPALLQPAAQQLLACAQHMALPPFLTAQHRDLFLKQERERRETMCRMAAELDRLQGSLHADALRICAAAELRALGVYTDQYLQERDGLILEDGVPALQRSIQQAWRRRLAADALQHRHAAEAAALQASQLLWWPAALDHVVPLLQPPELSAAIRETLEQ